MTCPNHASFRLFNRFLWTHKEVDRAPHPVIGLVLEVGEAEKSARALDFESLDPFSFRQQVGSMFHSHRAEWR